jgi:ribosome recycling factor
MRKSIETLIGEMKTKMSGYVVLLQYWYMNLCVKAEPASLLSVSVIDEEGEESNIEHVVSVSLANDYQFELYPHDQKMTYAISRAIKEAHPEFKIDIKTEDDGNASEEDDDQEKVIVCTMPEVNKDRHDTLMDGVGTLYDQCKAKLDANHAIYKARLTTKLVGSSEEDTKEAEDKLEEVYSKHGEIAQQYKENKEKEIEEAYQRYLDEQTAKQNEADEKAAARGVNAGQQFKMNEDDE